MGSFQEKSTRKIHTNSLYARLNVSQPKSKKKQVNRMENLSKTEKKKHMKKLSFITQFKIEFFLPFTGGRKVLRKMSVSKLFDVVVRDN